MATHTSSRPGRVALATITDTAYLPGTLVLLSSFLRHNRWFDGDIIVIHDGLDAQARDGFAHFPNVQLREPGAELRARIDSLAAARPKLSGKRAIFYSLETFALAEYDCVLKVDSDMLCTGDVAPLVDNGAALACCPDQPYFLNRGRDLRSYRPIAGDAGPTDTRPASFNAGMMCFRPAALPARVYGDLVELVHPRTWTAVDTGHTDSVVLNRYFAPMWTPVDARYNYMVSGQMDRATRPRCAIGDAVLIHFIGRLKPWRDRPVETMSEARREAFAAWSRAAAETGVTPRSHRS